MFTDGQECKLIKKDKTKKTCNFKKEGSHLAWVQFKTILYGREEAE
jgi:hypothetical protein